MKKTHRIAKVIALAIAAALLFVSGAASARMMPTFRLKARPKLVLPRHYNQVARYRAHVESRMRASQARINRNLARYRMSAAQRHRIKQDVAMGVSLIRQSVARVSQDNVISQHDTQQVELLAEAIRADLARTYGNLDSWKLL